MTGAPSRARSRRAPAAVVGLATTAALLLGAACSASPSGSGAAGTGAAPATSAPGPSTPGTSTPGTSTPGTSTPGTSTPGTTKPLVATYGPKACDLLTVDEIAPLLGFGPERVATTPANFIGGGYASACDFRHPEDPERKGKTVRILVFPPDTNLDTARQAMTADTDLDGLGVPAFVGRASEGSGSGPNTIVVKVPEQGFSITVVTGADRTEAELVALAKLALPRFLAKPRGTSSPPST